MGLVVAEIVGQRLDIGQAIAEFFGASAGFGGVSIRKRRTQTSVRVLVYEVE